MKEPITVLIPNFNGEKLLVDNLPTVIDALKTYCLESRVLVVDDGSTDNSLQVLNDKFADVKVVVHSDNRGFAEAVKSGIAATSTELVFLVNSDVQVKEEIFTKLVSYFDDQSTFSVSPLICTEDGGSKRHSWNLRQFKNGMLKLMKWQLAEAKKLRKQGEKLPTLYASGGSLMLRKSMFEALGGFDPIYKPFYGEDSDLGLRAWRQGWSSYFEPNAYIVHQSRGAIKENNDLRYVKCIRRRNRYLLEWIHLEPYQLALFSFPITLLKLIGEALLFDRTNLRGFCLAVPRIPAVVKKRAMLRRSSSLSLSDVLKRIRAYC